MKKYIGYIILSSVILILLIFISVYFIHQENVKKALINNTDKELIKRDLQIKDLQAKYDSVKNKKDFAKKLTTRSSRRRLRKKTL